MTVRALPLLVLLAAVTAAADDEYSADAYATCSACHLPDGVGVPGAFPPIRNRAAALARLDGGREYLAAVVIYGLMGTIQVDGAQYFGVMAGLGAAMSDDDIAAALNYIVFELSDDEVSDVDPFTAAEVERGPGCGRGEEPDRWREVACRTGRKARRQLAVRRLVAAMFLVLACGGAGAGADDERAHVNYMLHCQGCHLPQTEGFPGKVPPIRDFVGYFLHSQEGREFLVRVPGVAQSALSDEEVAELMNWLVVKTQRRAAARRFCPVHRGRSFGAARESRNGSGTAPG